MKVFSNSTWFCLGLTLLAILQAIHLSYISRQPLRSILPSQYPHDNYEENAATKTVSPLSDTTHSLMDDTLLSDDPSNLFYFIQVSDLHISKYRSQTERFLHFVQSALPMVSPSFVVVTGDLTDAKDVGDIKTRQYQEEWQLYQSALEQKDDLLAWYDMRGNHDCFDMPSWQSDVNLYRTFGKSAQLLEQGQGVYSWQMNQSYGQYRFVAMDACPKHGPARPLNFYGYITTNTMNRLEATLLDDNTYNHTFLFTHYPTTTMIFGRSSLGRRFKDLMQQTSIYFCGHLHRLMFGLGDILKSYDTTTQSYELELGDMKDHGVYRIVAVDHDLVSFVDLELPLLDIPTDDTYEFPLDNKTIRWPTKITLAPAVLITNPKDARYYLTNKEPIHLVRQSTHIRFLVFSPHDPSTLKVRIFVDDKRHPFAATHHDNNLWTSPWSPEDFDDLSSHSLLITVTAPDGQVGQSRLLFRVDGVRLMIGGGFGEWLIGTSAANIFKYTAIIGWTVMVLLLIVPKMMTDMARHTRTTIPATRLMGALHALDVDPLAGPYQWFHRQWLAWLLRFTQFPTMTYIYYPTWLFCLGFIALPWFRGDLIPSGGDDDRYGTFYLWGFVFGGNEWLPLGDSFMFGLFHLFFDVGIFLVLFAWRATDAEDLYCPSTTDHDFGPRRQQWNRTLWFASLEIIYWLWRMSSVLSIGSFYGPWSLAMNLLVWWMLFVAGVLVMGLWQHRSKRNRIHMALEVCPQCRTPPRLVDPPSSSSSSSSQTSIDGVRIKSRRKGSDSP